VTSDDRSWQWRRDYPAAEVLGGRGAAVVGQNVSSLGGSVGTATLRYAGRNRRSVIRRRVPPTSSARTEMAGIARTGIGSATRRLDTFWGSYALASPIKSPSAKTMGWQGVSRR